MARITLEVPESLLPDIYIAVGRVLMNGLADYDDEEIGSHEGPEQHCADERDAGEA